MSDAKDFRSGSRWAIALLLVAALVLAAIIVWRTLGSAQSAPMKPSAGAPMTIEQLASEAEADPGNSAKWRELGYAQFERNEYDAAAKAYRRAVKADEKDAVGWSALGEALVMASKQDPLPPAALDAFDKAIRLDPSDPRARYFLAVKKDLGGDHEGAITDWLALLEETPAGAPWEVDLERTIKQVGQINKIATEARIKQAIAARPPDLSGPELSATASLPGPSQQQIAAASAKSPAQQREMAEGMVARLEARLKSDPQNLDGWVMLMRSRVALDEPQKAREALDKAVAANPNEADRLRAEATKIGVR